MSSFFRESISVVCRSPAFPRGRHPSPLLTNDIVRDQSGSMEQHRTSARPPDSYKEEASFEFLTASARLAMIQELFAWC